MEVIPECEFAFRYACTKHKGQTRKHGEDFITHPYRVYELVLEYSDVVDVEILEAALLHDVLEDTPTLECELRKYFSERVVRLVVGLTRYSWESSKEYMREIKLDPELTFIKYADRISNLEDMYKTGDSSFVLRYSQNTKENYLDMDVPLEMREHLNSLLKLEYTP